MPIYQAEISHHRIRAKITSLPQLFDALGQIFAPLHRLPLLHSLERHKQQSRMASPTRHPNHPPPLPRQPHLSISREPVLALRPHPRGPRAQKPRPSRSSTSSYSSPAGLSRGPSLRSCSALRCAPSAFRRGAMTSFAFQHDDRGR